MVDRLHRQRRPSQRPKAAGAPPPADKDAVQSPEPPRSATATQNFVVEAEPTVEEIKTEQALLEQDARALRKKKKQAPQARKDLLASYMDQLSHIPLFTPAQELQHAQALESLELGIWQKILRTPRGPCT